MSADSAQSFFTITTSDTVNFGAVVRGIYVGTTGNVVAIGEDGVAVTFTAVPAGMILPIRAKRVNSTSTTASTLVGLT